jgi:ribosomal-protein-alanine N-acetyltransferase
MKEAVAPVIRYGFEQMQLNRIEAFIGSANEASQRLVKALGFREEGLLRKHYIKDGIAEDSLVFGLLRSEYQPV